MLSFEHTDAAFAPDPPALRAPEPALVLALAPRLRFSRLTGDGYLFYAGLLCRRFIRRAEEGCVGG